MVGAADAHATAGETAAAISNLVVAVFGEYAGRGPTQARTYLSDDLVSVVVRDGLTKAERSLVREGREQLVVDTRRALQGAMQSRLVAGVGEITGREVLAFFSDNHVDPDIAIEAFLLAPASGLLDGSA